MSADLQSESENLPKATRRRLIELESVLNAWQKSKITSPDISALTGWKDSLIRHDFWLAGIGGDGVSNGYVTADLLKAVQKANTEPVNVCIAGLGRLGAALLDESLFEGSGFVIKAGFDSNVNRVEILRSTFPLYPAGDMNWVIKQEHITKAILAVADKDAQLMCDRLIKAGISGIVNMTGRILKVPEGIKTENVSVITALKLVN